MGRMGASTGYPALGVTVTRAADAKNFSSKDILLIGSPSNQSLLQSWADDMPFSGNNNAGTFNVSNFTFGLLDWWHGTDRASMGPRRATLTLNGTSNDGILMGFKSPLSGSRSVVALVASTPQSSDELLNALMDADSLKLIQGGMTLVHGRTISSIASGDVYYAGSLPAIEYVRWALSAHPLLLALAGLILAVVIAALLFRGLRSIAARRLKK